MRRTAPADGSATEGRRSRMTTSGRLSVMMLAMTVLVLTGGGVGAAALSHTAAVSDRLADRISPARTAVSRLESGLLEQVAAVRGYLVTGDPELLRPYDDGVASERAVARRARDLLADEPGVRRELDAALTLADRWRADYPTRLIAARRAGATAAELAPIVERGRLAFDAAQRALTTLETRLDRLQAAGRADLDAARALRDLLFVSILAMLLLSSIVISVLVRVTVLRPLGRLGASVRQVAGGDFDHRLTTEGPADIARLTADVETMRQRVVDALKTSRRHRDALAEQAAELRRSNEDLEQFAYVASHDLQEPLRKVASFCQMLQRRYADQLDDRARQYIGYAVDGATRMQNLISDLLAFSRIGRFYRDDREVDLAEVLEQAESNLSRPIAEAGAVVTADPLPVVQGDPTLLTMLWQNLLGNAVKFRRADRAPRVRVEVTEEPAAWSFAVADNGIGIDPRYANKIFLIFQRLHARDAYDGTGIGLAICKKIVEYHGGALRLDDAYAGGARFVFTLPKPAAVTVPAQAGERSPAAPA
ncbi:CHASE3 domain-containing protein [Micromonospora soli]|uniref:sensor histidine kinase n=1 Tax=Micromonospora sp. NBRC 110009 TaxID=3061627 RepID=UPI0026738C34|nr:ATP-binding protein [Micromonospora sp. NBRC 110009]WKT97786.1 CHASE3 domain-containing protein [Micromonospora sp. NBRC 110009]